MRRIQAFKHGFHYLVAVAIVLTSVGVTQLRGESAVLFAYGDSPYNHRLGVHIQAGTTNPPSYCGFLGLKRCAKTWDMVGSGYRNAQNAVYPTRMELRLMSGFNGTLMTVTVGNKGVAAGFQDWGSTCGRPYLAANYHYIKVNAFGQICKSKATVSLSKTWAESDVNYRLGATNWFFMYAYKELSY